MNFDIKLKTCPCCGGEARLNSRNDPGLGIFHYFVTCSKCGLETPRNFNDPAKAMNVWNRRIFSDLGMSRDGLIKKLRDICKAYDVPYAAYETMKNMIYAKFEETTKDEKDKSVL